MNPAITVLAPRIYDGSLYWNDFHGCLSHSWLCGRETRGKGLGEMEWGCGWGMGGGEGEYEID